MIKVCLLMNNALHSNLLPMHKHMHHPFPPFCKNTVLNNTATLLFDPHTLPCLQFTCVVLLQHPVLLTRLVVAEERAVEEVQDDDYSTYRLIMPMPLVHHVLVRHGVVLGWVGADYVSMQATSLHYQHVWRIAGVPATPSS